MTYFVERLEIAAKITALLAFSASAGLYAWNKVVPARIDVEPPIVIEFRCQSVSFKFAECFEEKAKEFRNVSLSAALLLSASGPSEQSVTIKEVKASVNFPWDRHGAFTENAQHRQKIILSGFWTGDLTGGRGNLQQAVAESVSGKSSVRREYWMMPRPEAECAASGGGSSKSCRTERENFLPWHSFVKYALGVASKAPGDKPPRIEVEISVDGERSGLWGELFVPPIKCSIILGQSAVVALRDPNTAEVGEPGWLTLPCRQNG